MLSVCLCFVKLTAVAGQDLALFIHRGFQRGNILILSFLSHIFHILRTSVKKGFHSPTTWLLSGAVHIRKAGSIFDSFPLVTSF